MQAGRRFSGCSAVFSDADCATLLALRRVEGSSGRGPRAGRGGGARCYGGAPRPPHKRQAADTQRAQAQKDRRSGTDHVPTTSLTPVVCGSSQNTTEQTRGTTENHIGGPAHSCLHSRPPADHRPTAARPTHLLCERLLPRGEGLCPLCSASFSASRSSMPSAITVLTISAAPQPPLHRAAATRPIRGSPCLPS